MPTTGQRLVRSGRVEETLARLVDGRLVFDRPEKMDDVVAFLAEREDAAYRTIGADGSFAAAYEVGRRAVRPNEPVNHTGVDD